MDQLTYWFIFTPRELLLTAEGEIPLLSQLPFTTPPSAYTFDLSPLDGMPCRAVQLPSAPIHDRFQTIGLREAFYRLSTPFYQMAGKAYELLHWDVQNRFCGHCGTPLKRSSEISKSCPACGNEIWPHVAPAVITLIERKSASGHREDDELLLVQAKNFRGDYYGLVAGFVETGETLEHAVSREIKEETGLRIRNLRYRASQPWPFPSVLMLGFTAEYDGGELQLQSSELNKGGWFRRCELPSIPGKVSLARRLIDVWLEE